MVAVLCTAFAVVMMVVVGLRTRLDVARDMPLCRLNGKRDLI